MINKIQVVIVEERGKTKRKTTYEVTHRDLAQQRLKEIKAELLEALGFRGDEE